MLSKYFYPISIFLIVSSYLFGLVCIQFEAWPVLVEFSWFQMLLTGTLLLYSGEAKNRVKHFYYFLIAYLVGFFIEVAGVNTGAIFGQYSYGSPLGVKIWSTPLMIGVNWYITTLVVNDVLAKWKVPTVVHVLLGATIITMIDYLIEPDATRLGMWTWQDGIIPLKNYIAWWIVSAVLCAAYKWLSVGGNRLAPLVLVCMLLFFIVK